MPRPRIILADDHQILLDGLKELLSVEFDLVATVACGADLLHAARKLRPDVIVTDIGMPDVSGVDVAQTLAREGIAPKIVFLTMLGETEVALQAFRAGGLGYVLKHAAGTELVLAIREAMAGRTFISPRIAKNLVGICIGSASEGAPIAAAASPFTPRQTQVLRLVAQGKTMKEVAAVLGISTRTAEVHKYQMMERLGIRTVPELVKHGIRLGIVEMPN